jgi:hypothetical protein
MQYVPFAPGISVTGRTVQAVSDALKSVKVITSSLLEDVKTPARDAQGNPIIDLDGWYPLEQYLAAMKKIDTLLGGRGLERIGSLVIKANPLPPHVNSLDMAFGGLDPTYHSAHAKDGRPLLDPVTGKQLDGIGHYRYERIAGERRAICTCENPYPCRFDLGLLTTLAQRFEPTATLAHDPSQPCRAKGGDSCSYVITW